MSTAGKVLVVLVMLASLVWMLLTAGVTQLNRNGNQALIVLTEKVAKLQGDVKNTRDEIVRVKDQTHVLQEQMDRELAVINARQNDVQRLASTISENLSSVRYELATVQQTVQNAEQGRTERAAEVVADQKALVAARDEVKSLKATDEQLRARLASLRASSRRLSIRVSTSFIRSDREVSPDQRNDASPQPLRTPDSFRFDGTRFAGQAGIPHTMGAFRLAPFFGSPPASGRFEGSYISPAG